MFRKTKYPDGQISAEYICFGDEGIVRERINSYEDLFYIRAIADILQYHNMSWELFIPCLFGQRSDRRFGENQSFDLKLITDVINDCKFSKVSIFDPHSDVSMALINNSVKISSFEYVQKAVQALYEPETGINTCNFTLVSPDSGAYHKVFEYGKKLNLPVVAANKCRDLDGTINLKFTGDVEDKHCLIIDDLCSRGGTFLKLTEQLKINKAQKVYLYISHFEGGCEEYKQTITNLLKIIDGIYTTNSYRNFDEDDNKNLIIYKII